MKRSQMITKMAELYRNKLDTKPKETADSYSFEDMASDFLDIVEELGLHPEKYRMPTWDDTGDTGWENE